ncbi:glycosyltransferase family protein [bacterium]|nr:glycosyltransferase family protein [bacterium]
MQVSRRLVVKKEIPIDNSKDLLNSMDLAMAEYYCQNSNFERGLEIFQNLINVTDDEVEKYDITNKYINNALIYAQRLFNEKKYIEAIEQYRNLMKFSGFPINIYKNIGLCMKCIGNADLAIKFLKRFEEISPDKEDVYIYLADLAYTDIKDNKKAIEYYEKALEKNADNFSIYNMLGHLYSTLYQDKFKEKQIYYLNRAFELAPQNRIVVKNLAYVYGKFDEEQKADEMYSKLMYLSPTHSDLHAYGAYLVRHKRFSEGFKFLQHRFLKEDLGNVAFPEIFKTKKKRWNMKMDISDKKMLVHFEQGFGDSILFVRFAKELQKLCKEVVVVVQDGLISLFKDSNLGLEFYRESDVPKLNYDLWIPMMDLPIVLETKPNTIPMAQGYLKVPKAKINEYKKQYINDNDKLKIGIAFEGTLASKETDRDIPLHYLYELMKLPDVEVYSFQVDDLSRQMDRIPEDAQLIRLGKTFRNWEDTACAMNCMDLMVTTDNGVMNLAGALGIKTFGLFNRIVEWRWFDVGGKDVGWYKSIRPFQTPTSGAWEVPVAEVMEEVEKLRCKKVAEKIKGVKLPKVTKITKAAGTTKTAKPKE